jgi:hypothetical protein
MLPDTPRQDRKSKHQELDSIAERRLPGSVDPFCQSPS